MQKATAFRNNLICLLLVLFPCYLFSQPTFFGVARTPIDNNTNAGPTASVTPPASVVKNDLVVIFAEYKGTGATLSLVNNGNQSWNTATTNSGSNQTVAIFWCSFNGSWGPVGNIPVISAGVGNTSALTAVMYVFRPKNSIDTWIINVPAQNNSTTGTSTVTINGVTTTAANTVTMAFWSVGAANTWNTLTGAGWSKTSLSAQYRNTTSPQSHTAAYNLQANAATIPNVTQTESASTDALTSIISWRESNFDDCSEAASLTSAASCSTVTGSVVGATLSTGIPTPSCGTPTYDVWFKFVAHSLSPTITLSGLGANFNNPHIQLLSGTCGTFTEQGCASGTSLSASNLIYGNTYYIRIYSTSGTAPGTNGNFNICITDPSLPSVFNVKVGRMNEVFQRSVLSNNAINTPWEVTYGPDGFLWVTGNKDYKAYRIDPSTGTQTTILDLSDPSTDFPSLKVQFNNTTSPVQNPWPQGGFAGLAIHPQFNSNHYVYISYSRKFDSVSVLNSGCAYFKNSLVRFTYNTGTNKLENPVVICDTLPGGNDHNSQRLIIAPVGGTYYLFYPQGDLGAGQLACQWRPNHAQDINYYEGKILRFNLEPDADAGAYDKWIPDDNPYNVTLGKQSAVWSVGIRNNQGFAYDTTNNILYGSSHGPYSDDEINIIERDKNYGHPLVIGYSADGNYNNSNAGSPNTTSSLAVITDEVAAAAAIPNYKDPLFSGYAPDQKTISYIWTANPKNGTWPSEGWSGMDFYSNTIIPGWKNSLVICGLKFGRVLRLKLGSSGTTVVNTDGADTVAYFQSQNRYRDLAFAPNGKDIYVSNEGSTSSGPAGGTSFVPTCTNCITKYTFLGYADAGGKSTIPDAIDVTDGTVNTVDSATTVTIDNTNNMLWVPITGPDGNIMAEIYANGNNLGVVHSAFYKNSGAIRVKGGVHYLDRNITITPQTQPSSTVKIRLYISKAEYDALDADGLSGINGIGDLKIIKNEDPCSAALASSTTLINPTVAELHGSNGYVLQGDITGFSSFYFASGNVVLPLQLVTFSGSLQNNAALLKWVTTNEINVSHFDLERSINGVDFTKIGSETAIGGTTGKNNYTYTDYDACNQSSSVVYYRLKVVDINGSTSYSQIVALTFISTNDFLVRPNPVQQTLYVHGKKDFHKPLQIELYDLTGKMLIRQQSFKNDFSIYVSSLKAGVYVLKMYNSFDVQVQIDKVMKQ